MTEEASRPLTFMETLAEWFRPTLRRPKNGDMIEITWLPSPVNAPFVRSAYIGMSGKVEDMSKDGSFSLVGSGILLVGTRYAYKRIKT